MAGLIEFKNSLRLAFAVWKALFLREASVRMFGSRTAWMWLIAEPLIHIFWLVFVFTVIRVRHVGGIEIQLWIASGILVFLTFRRTLSQVQKGVGASRALFSYRQVQPADVVLARMAIEFVIMLIISFFVFLVGILMGWGKLPESLLQVFEAFFLATMCGFGLGMIFAFFTSLLPDFDRVLGFITMPLMMISGVIFPLGMVPEPYLSWLLLNPIAHIIESVRLAFAPYYHAVPGLDLGYAYHFALFLVFWGLLFFREFRQRLIMR